MGNKDFVRCDNCYESMGLTDPNFKCNSHGGYCVVKVQDLMNVVIINNPSTIVVEMYDNPEADGPIDTVVFPKADLRDPEADYTEGPDYAY